MRTIKDIAEFEDVAGKSAKKWVRARNRETKKRLDKSATFRKLYNEHTEKEDSPTLLALEEGFFYRFFTDDNHSKGILQNIKKGEFYSKNPKWDNLLDIDELSKLEKQNWSFEIIVCKKFKRKTYAMIILSRDGLDAAVAREFDLKKKRFVENGFYIPKTSREQGGEIFWHSPNHLLFSNICDDNALTNSKEARSICLLSRNHPIKKAKKIFEIDPS